MASTAEPPPKKRRTDDGQTSESSVADANSTVHIFMGQNQRQNRWMQGYVPARDDHAPAQTQTPAPSSRAVSSGQQQQRHAAGTTQAPATSPHTNSHIVQYESPVTTTPLSSNASSLAPAPSRKSMDRISNAGPAVGLPSPASSDGNGNMNSPAAVFEKPPPRRSRPPSITRNSFANGAVLPSTGSPSAHMHPQMPPGPHARPQQPTRGGQVVYVNNRAMYVPSNADAPQSGHAMQAPQRLAPQPVQSSSPLFQVADWNTMLQILEVFEKNIPGLQVSHVDFGRLSLLREAIYKHDWFYICLSQIHCLTPTPALLPQSAAKLPVQAITYLDFLLCSNSKLNLTVLKWLSDFPSGVASIYSSPARLAYDRHVIEVVEFAQRLPLHWDKLVHDCKERGAPPLMDDLLERLALRSPVLQATVFRAIARMLKEASEPLEQLHRMDQEGFARGRRKRTLHEKEEAYQAFRRTIKHMALHEQAQRNQDSAQSPRFTIPQDALTVFQFRPQLSMVGPNQGAPPNRFNPPQTQQSGHTSNQMSHLRHTSTGGSGSPPQPGTPTTPMTVTFGNVTMPRQQHPPGRRLVFPHESEQPRAQPTHPDTMRSALHQAHLRSPTLTPTNPDTPRLYRYVESFALLPRMIQKELPIETVGFEVAQGLYDALPATLPSDPGVLASRTLTEKSRTIRLRCASGASKALKSESAWMEADNFWPDNLYLQCNGHMLEPRRKLHHNRYLPIDLTSLIKSGHNELTVIVNRMTTDNRPYEYALAVEIVSVINHTTIQERLQHITAEDSLAAIKGSLAATNEDDEIAITSSTTIIQLFDPHTLTKIFDVPVRGTSCLHKDCFDLETFLSQRDPKNKPGYPSVVDCWRCPICRGDVRPHTLIRDEFMDSVREELEKMGLLNTRAILVEPDGSWKAKEEESGGVRSPSLEKEERASSTRSSITTVPVAKTVEIIEID